METNNKINAEATYGRVRGDYRSVLAFCRAHKCLSQTFYQVVKEKRGKAECAVESRRILKVLEDEKLLVRMVGDEAQNQ